MGVDKARRNDEPLRVQYLPRGDSAIFPDGDDPSPVHRHVRPEAGPARSVHHRAAFDQNIDHTKLLRIFLRVHSHDGALSFNAHQCTTAGQKGQDRFN